MAAMRAVKAADGTDHVETVGVDRNHVKEWKPTLDIAVSDLEFWGRIWERRNRGAARVTTRSDDEWGAEYNDNLDEAVEAWEDQDTDTAEAGDDIEVVS
jgi:hypothetical protein